MNKNKVKPLCENTTVDTLMSMAKEEMQKLKSEETFISKDLFKGYEWSRLSKQTRTKFGMLLYNYIEEGKIPSITAVKKTPQNHWLYKKE